MKHALKPQCIGRLARGACAVAAVTLAGGAYALDLGKFDHGAMLRVADTSTVPANSAPGMPGRTEGPRTSTIAANPSMSATADSAKQKLSDTTITTKVKAKLLETRDLKSTGIHVKTRDGVVSLTGSVPSSEQRQMALDAVRAIDGVSSVDDHLKVSGG